jgi:uncharacterized protein YidB (DUF937 family)
MSFLENLASSGVTSMLSNCSNPLAVGLLELINKQPGGVAGLVQTFHEKGLGEVVNSWVSTGQNLPISSDQIQHVLGSQQVHDLAARVGVSPDTISSQLTTLLPTLVDKLTPNGQVPDHGSLLETGMNILKSLEQNQPAA